MSTTRQSASRRAFLRAVGAGLATLPCFRLVENSYAQSVGDTVPLKFVGIYAMHGIAGEYYAMRQGETESTFDIRYDNCSLQPFDDAATYGKSFKDKILVLEGVDHLSGAGGHDSAGTMLTGSRIDGSKPLNSSIDYYLGVEKGLGMSTRVANVALAVGNADKNASNAIAFGTGGEALSKIIDPVAAFDLLMTGAVVGDDPAAIAAATRQRLLGKSVVDFVRGDVTRLRARLAGPEQQKLDQHLSALRELEKQFETMPAGGGMTGGMTGGGTCSLPKPDATKFPKLQRYNGGEPYFDAITDAHIDVLAQALACDSTRFATLFLNDLSYAANPLGLGASTHDDVAHKYSGSPVGSDGRPGDGDPASWVPLAKFNRYSFSKVARLMQKLDQLGALDSTLLYVSSDMGNPSLHSCRNVPIVLAGGVNGKIRMGRRLRMKSDCPVVPGYCQATDTTTVSNNHVLVSILQAFGVNQNEYGTQPVAADKTGGLTGLI